MYIARLAQTARPLGFSGAPCIIRAAGMPACTRRVLRA